MKRINILYANKKSAESRPNMKSFKQLMGLIKEEKERTEPIVPHSGYSEKRKSNPHSVLHEVETVAHFNAMSDARRAGAKDWRLARPTEAHYSQIMPKADLDTLRQDVDKRSPTRNVNAVQKRAVRDAGILAEKHPDHEQAHWTPHDSTRKALHPDVTHSGDVVLIPREASKPAMSYDLKWGKGGSVKSPTEEEVTKRLRLTGPEAIGTGMQRANLQTDPQSRRGELFGSIGETQKNAFNRLGDDEKRSFVKLLWGSSSHPDKVAAHRLHADGHVEEVDKSFNAHFPVGADIKATRPPVGRRGPLRGFRIESDGIHKLTLGSKYNSFKKFVASRTSDKYSIGATEHNTKIAAGGKGNAQTK